MSTLDYEAYFKTVRDPAFEKSVQDAAEKAVQGMDKKTANEVKLRYITHVFAKTLDDIADWLVNPRTMN